MASNYQCVICSTVLSNESMKPSKLQHHLETTHSHLKDKPVEDFQTSLKSLQGKQTLMRNQPKLVSSEMLFLSCSSDCPEETAIHTWRGLNNAFNN